MEVCEQNALDERVQFIEFGQLHVDLVAEVLLELEGSATSGTNRGHQLGHALLLGEGQEVAHVRGLKADEMQGASSFANLHIVHLKERKE